MEYSHGGDIYGNQNIILDYSVNTNPLGMPERVRQAAVRAVDFGSRYPDSQCRELRKAIACCHQTKPEWSVCGNGAADLIFCLAQVRRPKKALVLAPTFSEYENALHSVGCQVSYYELKREKGYTLDEGLAGCLSPELDMVFLCNPNNPTGKVAGKDIVEKLLAACRSLNILAVVDECFMDFVENGEDFSLAGHLGEHKNLFLLKAFTKSYAMAGIRLGYGLCADEGLLAEMETCRQPWSVSLIAQEAGKAALEERGYLEAARELVGRERRFLTEGLKGLTFQVFDSAANYLLFHGDEDGSLYKKALERGVLIRDCSNYKGLLTGDYRICVGTHENNEQLLKIFESIVREKRE